MPATPDTRQLHAAANEAAEKFAARGEADEWAVSRLMADRYAQQLDAEEKR
ncbi:hypothetical protein [Nonomuraea sp. NPDC050643]|uniref:hypothetical protein n=1 Tax=Nonomuraea sp. NPDC050643 TaxID=3155660 RepID=UPI0033E99B73